MPRQVIPENLDEKMQNQVKVIWLTRKDTRLNLDKTLSLFENSNEQECVIISEYYLVGKASILR